MTPSLDVLCTKGIPGLNRIEYVYLEDVDPDSLLAIVGQQYNRPFDAVLLRGSWQRLPCFRPPLWTETHKDTDQGSTFEQKLTASVRSQATRISGIFDELTRNPLLLRITDRVGQKWICGDLQQGFRLTYRRSPGGGGQFAGYDLTLQGLMSSSSAGWNPLLS